MTDVVIAGAARTLVGAFNGGFSTVQAHELGVVAIKAALERAEVAAEEVDEVVLGQVLTAGESQNPARQAAIGAGVPVERTAYVINQVCGSGLRTIALGAQAVKPGRCRHRGGRGPGEHERFASTARTACICGPAPRWATPR